MFGPRGAPDLERYRKSAQQYYEQHLEALRTNNYKKRVDAEWGLIARGGDSLPYLTTMLRSSDPDSREDAAGALGWLAQDADGLVAELLEALEREAETEARDSIVLALGDLKNRAAVPALAAMIRSEETDGDTRHCAVESLGKIVRKRFLAQPDPTAAAIAWLDAHP